MENICKSASCLIQETIKENPHSNSLRLGVGDFAPGAFADVASEVDDEDFIGHVDLAFVHVVEHGFGAFSPYFIVSTVTEQAD